MMAIVLEVVLGLLLLLFLLVYFHLKWTYKHWASKGIPYLEPKIPFGNSESPFSRKESMGVTMRRWYEEFRKGGHRHGGIYLFTSPMYFPVDPEIVKTVISRDFQYFTDRGISYNEKVDPLSAHLITIGGSKWKNLRSKLTPTFSSGKLKMMFPSLIECTINLQETVQRHTTTNEPLDTKEVLSCFTTDVIGSCAFGLECNSFKEKDAPFRKYGKLVFTVTKAQAIRRLLTFAFPSFGKLFRFRLIRREVSEFFVQVVRETVTYRETHNVSRRDFLQLLIDLRKTSRKEGEEEEESALTIEQMAAQAFAFFVAGFETSSATMTFCLYELARHPVVQRKVREEVREVLKRHGGQVTYEAIHEMKYMGQVLDETLRIYPAIPSLNRQCTKDYHIPDTDVVIEKGTKVLISILGLHHDPEYFPEPEKFDPDRFSDENKNNIRPFTYLPFGDGPRNCIGLRFGLMQSKVGLAVLLKDYEFTLNPKTRTPLKMHARSMVLAADGGVWLDVKKLEE